MAFRMLLFIMRDEKLGARLMENADLYLRITEYGQDA